MAHRYEIEETITQWDSWFDGMGTQLTVRLLPPSQNDARDPISHFVARNMVGIFIQNHVN